MQPAKIHFGDLAVLDTNECQYQLDGQKCNICQKLSKEPVISKFWDEKKRWDIFLTDFLFWNEKKVWMAKCILQK